MDEIQKFLFDHLDNNGEIHLNYDKSAVLLTMINEMKRSPIEVTQESNYGEHKRWVQCGKESE